MADDIARQAQPGCVCIRQAKIAIGGERAELGDGVGCAVKDSLPGGRARASRCTTRQQAGGNRTGALRNVAIPRNQVHRTVIVGRDVAVRSDAVVAAVGLQVNT